MSKTTTKSYGRGKYSNHPNTALQTSIQFDKAASAKTNKPTAAKSTGTVGKWGITSFTSIRSVNPTGSKFTVGKRDARKEAEKRQGAKNEVIPEVPPAPRPKKFFKSRNQGDSASQEKAYQSTSSYSASSARKLSPSKDRQSELIRANDEGKKENSTRRESVEQTEAMNLSSSPTKTTPERDASKPPIVLRIFKGTSQLLTEPLRNSNYESNRAVIPEGKTRSHKNSKSEFVGKAEKVEKPKAPRNLRRKHTPESSENEEHTVPKRTLRDRSKLNKVISYSDADDSEEIYMKDVSSNSNLVENQENLSINYVTNNNNDIVNKYNRTEELLNELNECATVTAPNSAAEDLKSESAQSENLEEDRRKLLEVLEGSDDEKPKDKTDAEGGIGIEAAIQSSALCPPAEVKEFLPSTSSLQPMPHGDVSMTDSGMGSSQDSDKAPNAEGGEWLSDEDVENDNDGSGAVVSTDNVSETTSQADVPFASKRSIFKSRVITGDNKKRLALYKHKWCDDKDKDSAVEKPPSTVLSNSVAEGKDEFDFGPESLTRVTTVSSADSGVGFENDSELITRIKCPKEAKGFYTVVRNVKRAHQIQESGEFQEFNDDVEYILDALKDNNPIGTRCLSAISLASKCMAPAFRMHVRAHGTVTKFFKALHDAAKDQSLGMCTATVMFVLSQDRLNMDLDRDSLELMLNLLESDTSHRNALDTCGLTDSQLRKTIARVRELCAEIQSQGHAKHLNLDNITVGHLAMETLLSLTSRRAGEWFKEELRELGGLEHIVQTIVECCRLVDDTVNAWSPPLLEKICKVDRCLRVLENVTFQNEENNAYLLQFKEGILLDTVVKLFKVCDAEIPLYPSSDITDKQSVGAILRETLLATLKVLINLTHNFSANSQGALAAGQKQGMIDNSLHVLLQIPQHIPDEEKFDCTVLALILLINLVEHNDVNRRTIIHAKAPAETESIFETKSKKMAVEALVELFYQQENLARTEEKKTDAILDGDENEKQEREKAKEKSKEENMEETIAMLLQKAGRHMEHTLIAAYVGLLLGYLTIDNDEFDQSLRRYLPENNFSTILSILKKFYDFMNLTAAATAETTRGIKATNMIIMHLTECDSRYVEAHQGLDCSLSQPSIAYSHN
nr:PREDICTED: protein wings apart-like [Bemisia tabaci]